MPDRLLLMLDEGKLTVGKRLQMLKQGIVIGQGSSEHTALPAIATISKVLVLPIGKISRLFDDVPCMDARILMSHAIDRVCGLPVSFLKILDRDLGGLNVVILNVLLGVL